MDGARNEEGVDMVGGSGVQRRGTSEEEHIGGIVVARRKVREKIPEATVVVVIACRAQSLL
jgi:hypothetical protein